MILQTTFESGVKQFTDLGSFFNFVSADCKEAFKTAADGYFGNRPELIADTWGFIIYKAESGMVDIPLFKSQKNEIVHFASLS